MALAKSKPLHRLEALAHEPRLQLGALAAGLLAFGEGDADIIRTGDLERSRFRPVLFEETCS
jgi:hypothetical protein